MNSHTRDRLWDLAVKAAIAVGIFTVVFNIVRSIVQGA